MSCGYSTLENPAFTNNKKKRTHIKPWTSDEECKGRLENIAIGYRYRTDILELDFPTLKTSLSEPTQQRSLWLSLLYAFVNGACRALDISERDLGGCLYYTKGLSPHIILFDTAPGGAGFTREIKDNFGEVVKESRLLLDCQYCEENSSCISCLRTYYNQRDHNLLSRGLAKQYFDSLL